MVKEKEYRQKELLKMMSVTESDIGWSWFVHFFLFHLFTATLCAFLSTQLFTKSSFLLLWIFWLYTMIGTIVFCMVISSITSKATRAVMIGNLLFFSGAFLTLAQPYDTGNKSAVNAISLHPIAAFSYGIKQIAILEEKSVGLIAGTVSLSDNRNGYSFRDTLLILLVDSVVWGFLAWYLNRVIPPDYGQALPVWFPFLPSYWFPNHKTAKPPVEMAEDVEARNSMIPYESAGELKRQVAEGKSIEINNLRKAFGEKIAIDNLNLSIYSGQITALLGHNGTVYRFVGIMSSYNALLYRRGKDNNYQRFDWRFGCHRRRRNHFW
jgi:ATP-binding cassette, subfamily A (ABC1), member 3